MLVTRIHSRLAACLRAASASALLASASALLASALMACGGAPDPATSPAAAPAPAPSEEAPAAVSAEEPAAAPDGDPADAPAEEPAAAEEPAPAAKPVPVAELRGRFGFDWLHPESTRCKALDKAFVARLEKAQAACQERAPGESFGVDGGPWHSCTAGDQEWLIFATRKICTEMFETMMANAG
jgi:hypothetical protein